MGRHEWLIAAAVALGVAGLIVAGALPPAGWADDPQAVPTPPPLPSTSLEIAELGATVIASFERAPGEAVKVKLTVTAPPERAGESVPVTVTLTSISSSPMSRIGPMPRTVCSLPASVAIGPAGSGEATVELPLVWTGEPAAKPNPDAPADAPSPVPANLTAGVLASNSEVQQVQRRVTQRMLLVATTTYRLTLSGPPAGPNGQTPRSAAPINLPTDLVAAVPQPQPQAAAPAATR